MAQGESPHQRLHQARSLFPQLSTCSEGWPLVYLDTAATALKPEPVIERQRQFLRSEYATVNRSLYGISLQATQAIHRVRQKVAQLVGLETAAQVIFTRGTTDSLNLVALATQLSLKPGDQVVVTAQEHHSNLVPWQLACQRSGATLRVIPLTETGEWDLSQLSELVGPRCRLVACSAVSNVLGHWNPVHRLVEQARRVGARVVLDAAQAVGSSSLSLEELGVDFLAFSAHKVYGPTGLGVLCGTQEALESLPPVQGGGDMIDQVGLESSTYAALPHRLEAGTPAIAEIIGWEPALDLLQEWNPARVGDYTQELVGQCREELLGLGCRIISPSGSRALCSFQVPGWHPSDVAQLLSCRNIAIRSGHLCAQPLLRHFGASHLLRASFGVYSSTEDLNRFIQALKQTIDSA